MFGFTKEHLTRNIVALALAPLAYLLLAYMVLVMTHKEKR